MDPRLGLQSKAQRCVRGAIRRCMQDSPTNHLCAVELAFEGKAAPDWVQLTPVGPDISARDGRRFRLTMSEQIIAAFTTLDKDLPIDVEHASEVRASRGLDAPAFGWITAMEIRDGAIWGKTSWTDQGAAWVTARAYRFLSPAFLADKITGEMVAITSAGLTSTPAFKMKELARAGTIQENENLDKAIAEALGLDASATAAQAVARIKDLRHEVETASTKAPDPDKYVPAGQLTAANAKITQFETAETARADAAVTGAVEAGIAAGKIAPAAKDDYLVMARALGIEKFTAGGPK